MRSEYELFLNTPAHISQWSDFLSTSTGQALLKVLKERIPNGFPARGQAVRSEDALMELGRINGYRDCLRLLELLSNPPKEADGKPIQTDYAVDPLDGDGQ